jgi:hypothetical protein
MPALHSTPVSESFALAAGLTCGVVGFTAAGLITADYNIRMWIGGSIGVLANLIVGAPINLMLLDLIGLVVARPLSAIATLKLLAVIANAWLGGHSA